MADDKFSFYLDDGNNVREMDHFKALQLPEGFENNFDLEQVKVQYKKFAVEFHPDKNFNSLRSKICFQRISLAYEILSDEQKRKDYLSARSSEFHFDDHFDYDLGKYFMGMVGKIDELLERLEKLNASKSTIDNNAIIPAAQGIQEDSLDNIAMEFSIVYRGTMITEELWDKQDTLFKKIQNQAKTGDAFYYLFRITQSGPGFYNVLPNTLLHKAAEKGSLLAIRTVASKALSGHYTPLEESIKWGLKAIRYLEETAIPELKKLDPTSEILIDVVTGLQRLRERGKDILPEHIPGDESAFNDFVNQYLEYRKKRGGVASDNFKLSMDLFVTSPNTNTLQFKPVEELDVVIQPIPAEKTSVPKSKPDPVIHPVVPPENNLMQKILEDFAAKIKLKKSEKNYNKKAIAEAEKLLDSLNSATATYNNLLSKKTAKDLAKNQFIDECSRLISTAKPLLEKELGWGAYLTNLLKSIVNAVISATNAIAGSRLTLFALTKAPMMPEVEEVEQNIQKNINEPK